MIRNQPGFFGGGWGTGWVCGRTVPWIIWELASVCNSVGQPESIGLADSGGWVLLVGRFERWVEVPRGLKVVARWSQGHPVDSCCHGSSAWRGSRRGRRAPTLLAAAAGWAAGELGWGGQQIHWRSADSAAAAVRGRFRPPADIVMFLRIKYLF